MNKFQGILKTIDPYFDLVWNRNKTFELRKNDRSFKVHDEYYLVHYDPHAQQFLDRWVVVDITCVLETEHLAPGHVAFGFKELDRGFDWQQKEIALIEAINYR